MTEHKSFWKRSRGIYRFLIVVCTLAVVAAIVVFYFKGNGDGSELYQKEESEIVAPTGDEDPDRVENGIHARTGLIDAPGMTETIQNCTSCHSAKIIIQNRMDKERWIAAIRWMQETQNLWNLGQNEDVIVNYLVTNYPPKKVGRRANLTDIDWYELKEK